MLINIVGWHIAETEICYSCGKPASFLVISALDDGTDFFNVCRDCIDKYEVNKDFVGDAILAARAPVNGSELVVEILDIRDEESVSYVDLTDVVNFEGFDWEKYYEGERDILQPQLEALGYIRFEWGMGEQDSFGPLSRMCKALNTEGKVAWFFYG